MSIIKLKRTVRTSTTFRIEVSREELLEILAPHLNYGDIPNDADVYIKSLEIIYLEEDHPLVITWIEDTVHDES